MPKPSVRKAHSLKWIKANRKALDAYNRHIERDGLFADRFRSF